MNLGFYNPKDLTKKLKPFFYYLGSKFVERTDLCESIFYFDVAVHFLDGEIMSILMDYAITYDPTSQKLTL